MEFKKYKFTPEFSVRDLKDDIAEITKDNGRLAKYNRNLRRYLYTPYLSLQSIANAAVVGYWEQGQADGEMLDAPQVNVIKSVIDTLTSKIAQSKVRPYFNCIAGDFKDIKLVKQCQQFFDIFFENQKVNKTVSNAFKDACIFDTGVIFVDVDSGKIVRILPNQFYFFQNEFHYGKMQHCLVRRIDYPVSALPDFLKKEFKEKLKRKRNVEYSIYFDIENKLKAYTVDSCEPFVIAWESEALPIVLLQYTESVNGGSSQSVVDMLNSIQLQIDFINARITEALELSPALTYFVPSQSNIKINQIDNRVGKIIEYDPVPSGMGDPITSHTPNFIDSSYSAEREALISIAYDMVGVSQLSAQSKKPTGVDSGKALLTIEDVESERFETQLNQVIRAYTDLAKICIAVLPREETILPKDTYRQALKWKDIEQASKMMSVQFSGADVLSKDPSLKLQQLQTLAQAGVIPSTMIARYMEIPDLEGGYSLATNANDAVDAIIDRVLTERKIELPSYIPFTLLKETVINTQLMLTAANLDDNKDDIELLQQLYDEAEMQEKQWLGTINEAAAAVQSEASEIGNVTNVLEQEAGMVQAGTVPEQAVAEQAPNMPQPEQTPTGRETGWDLNQ